MKRSTIVTWTMIAVGVVLMVVSYFFLATPWCNTAVECSNPRVPFAPAIFVLGVLIAFSSAVYYAVAKD
ncbi:MAG: hypothetical protein KatS3mg011_1665 [Acidimicrobiia bacterium]|nr:MAG: hypothetical protein KatS3mg011_1665 [Acidimicrobiia bacterium]